MPNGPGHSPWSGVDDVPTGETTLRAAHFRVITCTPLTFRVTAGPAAPYAVFTALTHGTGGYLLLTGLLSTSADDYFRLSKYFLQILAGVTSTDIVRDPTRSLRTVPSTDTLIPKTLR